MTDGKHRDQGQFSANRPASKPSVGSKRKATDEPSRPSPVFNLGFRWSLWDAASSSKDSKRPAPPTAEQFSEKHKELSEALKVFSDHWVFQLERGEDGGRLHYQGFCHLARHQKKRPCELGASLNAEFFGIQFQPASKAGTEALRKYAMKDDTRVAGPWADKPIYNAAQDPLYKLPLHPWQSAIKESCTAHPDDRTVNWVCNKGGRVGKSWFTKFMFIHHDALCLSYGTAGDLLNLVSKNMGRRTYFFDLPRVKPGVLCSSDLYAAVESVKNGMVMNTKYETKIEVMKSPHVWVFSNELPNFESLTGDRWKVWEISPDLSLQRFNIPAHKLELRKQALLKRCKDAEKKKEDELQSAIYSEMQVLREEFKSKHVPITDEELYEAAAARMGTAPEDFPA